MRSIFEKMKTVTQIILLFVIFGNFPIHAQSSTVEDQSPSNILVLNSYHWGYGWVDGQVRGIMERLNKSKIKKNVYLEQLDIARQEKSFDDELYKYFFRKRYEGTDFNIIVATDDFSLRFIAKHYHEMFKGIPVVFSDVSELGKIKIPAGMEFTGVTENRNFQSTLDLARRLRPNASRIVVFGNSVDNGSGPRAAQDFFAKLKSDIPVDIYLDKSMAEIIEISSKLDPKDIVFPLATAKDRSGKLLIYFEVSRELKKVSPAPTFTFWSVTLNRRHAVGGKVSDPVAQGRTAAEQAIRILQGESASQIPHVSAPTQYMFVYPLLERHGIGQEELPEDSIVLDRPIPIYELYTKEIWGIAGGFISLFGLITVLLFNIGKRRTAEIALAASRDELEDKVKERTVELVASNNSLNDTLRTLELAQEQLVESEKMAALGGLVSGVAHEINTPLGVSLTAATYFEESADGFWAAYGRNELTRDGLEEFLSRTRETSGIIVSNLARAADLIRNFKQVAVDQDSELPREIDLHAYLDMTVNSLLPKLKQQQHVLTVKCPKGIVIETYPGIIAQIISNLVLNSVYHGFGSDRVGGNIRLEASKSNDLIEINYSDDGKGMPPDVLEQIFEPFFTTTRGQGDSGLGLSISYNLITHKLRGRMVCTSTPGKGTQFTISFPIGVHSQTVGKRDPLVQRPLPAH